MAEPVLFSSHARKQMRERGATEEEVRQAISLGEKSPARGNRHTFRFNLAYDGRRGDTVYATSK